MKSFAPSILSALIALAASQASAQDEHHHHDHQAAPSESNPEPVVDHSTMDHSKMDHSSMDHGAMDHGSESAPEDARDPHAYSGGFTSHQNPYMQADMPTHMHGGDELYWAILVDRLETVAQRDTRPFQQFEASAWLGSSFNKLRLNSEGVRSEDKIGESENEALWAHAISPYWDTLLGVRYDAGDFPGEGYAAFGIQGIAPYWFETNLLLYIGDEGRLALKGEAEYEWLFTQRLILGPRLEADFKDVLDRSDEIEHDEKKVSFGLRLRYEIERRFAPYIGVEWQHIFSSKDSAKTVSEAVGGLKFWL